MKRKKASFTGTRPIYTGNPSIVPGGFNLDRDNQRFNEGDYIPGGVLAIRDEEKRTVQVIKTAKVADIDAENAKIINLHVDEFYAPCFNVGDSVLKADAISGTFAAAPTIEKIEENGNLYRITLSAAITGLAKGDVIEEVVKDASNNAAERGKANSLTLCDVEVKEFETSMDVTADTMQYALFEKRVPPIPSSQKDATGFYLAANPHVKLTKSH